MRQIKYRDYNISMGPLIDVDDPENYFNNHMPEAKNIPKDKLLCAHSSYLNKDKTYYITCSKGIKSKKTIRILEFYGYNVIQLIKE